MHRRRLLTGVGAAGLAACVRVPAEARSTLRENPDEAAAVRFDALDLSDLEAAYAGRMGFIIHALNRGWGLAWRAEERFSYCSTFKLFLAAATLERVQNGQESLTREVGVQASDLVSHAPVTQPAVGSSLSIGRLCQAAVEVSDNLAANILIREIGGLNAMRIWYRSIGDDDTRVDRWELELNVPDGEKDTVRPQQAARNLNAVLMAGDEAVLDTDNRRRLATWLVNSPTGAGRIKAGVPATWTVAHKTGTAAGAVNDIGVLWTPDDEPFVVAAYFDGEAGSAVAAGEAVIAEATRRAVEVFS